jgi:hypothetical protein
MNFLVYWARMDAFDGRQITAARALAGLTIVELADSAGVTPRTVHRLETSGTLSIAERKRHGFVSREVWERIVDVLARNGVELTPETMRAGSGVRWVHRRAQRGATSPSTGS